ncbi:MAG: AMP-binding protein, partial [Desulfobulbaceae bacterium]|nr:AMP-binding protein [Desulfobulbaceae bacterium]
MKNIAETLKKVAKEKKNQTGLIEARTGIRISFGELDSRSDNYAAYLHEKGLSPGDTVILMVKPSADFICLAFALFKLGTPVVLIDPGMGYKNLLLCIERVHAGVLIGIPKALLFSKLFPKPFHSVRKTFCCGKSLGLLGADIRNCKPDTVDPFPVFKPAQEDLAAIIFTTGSTGPPKGVRYDHSVFAAQLRLIRDYYGIGCNDIDQPAFPLFALFSAALGACSIIPDMDATQPAKVDPEKFVASIKKYKVSYSFGSPAIWNVVSKYCIKKKIVLDSVNKVLMAGAPVPYDLLQRVTRILPEKSSIFTPYGATESLPIASISGSEILADTWAESVKGKGTCVGRALPGLEIRILAIVDRPIHHYNKEDELGPFEIGEIVVKG